MGFMMWILAMHPEVAQTVLVLRISRGLPPGICMSQPELTWGLGSVTGFLSYYANGWALLMDELQSQL